MALELKEALFDSGRKCADVVEDSRLHDESPIEIKKRETHPRAGSESPYAGGFALDREGLRLGRCLVLTLF